MMNDLQQQKDPKSMLRKLFEELALVLTPSALIALFSQLLDVSNKDTAAISLVVALAAALCIHRTSINQFIPSVWPTALVLALGAVFYFQYDEILLKDTGLLRWYRQSSDVHQEIRQNKGVAAKQRGSRKGVGSLFLTQWPRLGHTIPHASPSAISPVTF